MSLSNLTRTGGSTGVDPRKLKVADGSDLVGFSSDTTPTSIGNFANIPFTSIAKNINLEYTSTSIQPIEDCIYQLGGQITIDSPSDGVRLAVRIYNETDNIVLLTLLDTRLWAGVNSVPFLGQL